MKTEILYSGKTFGTALAAESQAEQFIEKWTGHHHELPSQAIFVFSGHTPWIMLSADDPNQCVTSNGADTLVARMTQMAQKKAVIVISQTNIKHKFRISMGNWDEIVEHHPDVQARAIDAQSRLEMKSEEAAG